MCVCVYFQLLATVLSQSTKAKEHLLEQSKSVDQPAGKTALIVQLWFCGLYSVVGFSL